MSLLNDALKRAQQERTPARPPLLRAAEPTARIPASPPAGSTPAEARAPTAPLLPAPAVTQSSPFLRWFFGLVIAGTILASGIAFVVFIYLQVKTPAPPLEPPRAREHAVRLTPPPAAAAPAQANPADAAPPPEPAFSPLARPQPPPAAAVILPVLPATAPAAEPAPAEAPLQPSSDLALAALPPPGSPSLTSSRPDPAPLAPLPAAPPPSSAAFSPTPAPPGGAPATSPSAAPDPALEAYIRSARVTGVKLAGADSKVVLNNRVYRLEGEILELYPKLKIVTIDTHQIDFLDERGVRYTKRF